MADGGDLWQLGGIKFLTSPTAYGTGFDIQLTGLPDTWSLNNYFPQGRVKLTPTVRACRWPTSP